MITDVQSNKLDALRDALGSLGRVAVAFSGGVDSTLLLTVAHEVLGDGVLALTVSSPFFPGQELQDTQEFCKQRSISQLVMDFDVLGVDEIAANPPDRCYLCKKALFQLMLQEAAARGFNVVVEGSNTDDLGDYRPGRKALAELDIQSPLLACGLSKQDIRDISLELDLPTWDKPALACLASRFPCRQPITAQGLARVDRAEQLLFAEGFSNVRVRHIGNGARIEVPAGEVARFADEEFAARITRELLSLGFGEVDVDQQGYRMGNMNGV